MESSYEDIRRKTMEENKKRMEALNLTHLSQSLHKSSSTISKTSPRFTKGRPRVILPGDLQVTKMKHLRRHGLQPTFQVIEPLPSPMTTPTNPPSSQAPPSQAPPFQAPPSQATTSLAVQTIEPHLSPVTTTPTTVQATEATPSQVTTPRSVQETETTHFQETSSHSEDVVEDEPEISQKRNFTFWDVEVINEAGHISKTHLRVSDVLEAPPNVSRIITRWNSNGQPVGSAAGLLGGFLGEIARKFKDFPIMYDNWKLVPSTRKNEIFKDKIQSKFVVDDKDNKKYILSSLGKKWRDARCRLFKKFYKWDISLEENLQNYPRSINQDHWTIFVQYRRKTDTVEKADKNAANREKLKILHTLGSKTLARKRDELELRDGRKYSRGEMYSICHKKSDGSFVNDEAKEKYEQLQAEIGKTPSPNEAFVNVFGKEHPGYVRCMGLGITPSQITTSTSHSVRSMSSSEANEKMEKMQAEIDRLKKRDSEVDMLKEQIAFLMQMQNSRDKHAMDIESPIDGRRSSESSHQPDDRGTTSLGTN
ncbi:uncharacterized protein [Cicer arietinum]|uniref:uncharacterized protein n=1 Tax=Cicer arietinum TaxID=3827 RepID=UPI003CC55F98